VVFRERADGGFEAPKPINVSWHGIPVAAKLVRVSDGYLAFVKVLPPSGRIPDANPRRGFGAQPIQPGWLEVVRLDADLKAAGTTAPRRSDGVVFELDAIATEGRVALLTTTTMGGTIAILDEQDRSIVDSGQSGRRREYNKRYVHLSSTGSLTSPSLLFVNGALYVAAIADAGPAARTVGTKVDLTSAGLPTRLGAPDNPAGMHSKGQPTSTASERRR
jgi:hypothetical protein